MTRIKDIRLKQGLTQQELSNKSQVPIATIQKLERGANSVMGARVDTLKKISKALNSTIEEIITMNIEELFEKYKDWKEELEIDAEYNNEDEEYINDEYIPEEYDETINYAEDYEAEDEDEENKLEEFCKWENIDIISEEVYEKLKEMYADYSEELFEKQNIRVADEGEEGIDLDD